MRFPAGAAVCMALLATPVILHAQNTTLTFEANACAGTGLTPRNVTSYSEGGYTITGTFLQSSCSGRSSYAGSTALFENALNSSATLARTDLTPFRIFSIALAQLLAGRQNAGSFVFTGNLAGGGTVSQTFVVPSQASGSPVEATYAFSSAFDNLASVTFAPQNAPYYQFDNVEVSTAPEPASLMLLGTGFFAVAGVVRRRRRGIAARPT